MKNILLVGSSIFQQWSNAEVIAPGWSVKNRAIGGTTTSYWTQHLDDVLAAESPDAVLFYCGSNDIANDVPEDDIAANVAQCCKIVHSQTKITTFAYFSIIKAPQKAGKLDIVDRLNKTIKTALPDGDLYIETNKVFFCNDHPVERFYIEDGLHLTLEAYEALSAYTQPFITGWMATL